jgi:hypothetical protein
VLRVGEFLVAGAPYRLTAGSVGNINGVGGGGGETTLVRALPRDSASAADTGAAADTVRPDTGSVRAGGGRPGRSGWPFLGERRR